jgi:hypothetical protein
MKMKSLVCWLLIFCAQLLVSFKATAQMSKLSVHVVLKGKVTDSNGKPLAKVAVTDGNNIIRTDAQGKYRLEATRDAMFVYITVPSGYEIPAENNMAVFYKRIIPVKGVFVADFVLRKSDQDDNRHYAIVWADPQINNQEEADQLLSTAVPDTRLFAAELKKKGPVVGIAAGDLSWDAAPIIPAYKKAIQETGIPFFQVLGNHDMDINVRSDEQSDSTFRKSMGPSWYSFNRGKAHYIVLDNVFYYSDGYNYMGYITEQQFRWLEQDLSTVQKESLVFVSMHISAYTNEKTRIKAAADNPGDITVNRRFLYDLLKPYKAHLLTGHTHYNENIEHENIYEHIHAAVCGTWWIAPLCGDGTPRGYGVYEINGDSLTWHYKTIGKSSNYQMRVYNKGSYPERPLDVAVNVWNWDASWKVNWYEDNAPRGEMKRETALDAAVITALTGPDRPAKYPWARPLLTDHIFFATPSVHAKSVTIEVTDRFGNKYVETIGLK